MNNVKTTLATGAIGAINHAVEALQQLDEFDTFDYEAHGKLSILRISINQLKMVRDDIGRLKEILENE